MPAPRLGSTPRGPSKPPPTPAASGTTVTSASVTSASVTSASVAPEPEPPGERERLVADKPGLGELHPAAHRPASLTVQPSPRHMSLTVNPLEAGSASGPEASRDSPSGPGSASQGGTESPGTSQMSPPPSYHDIPGTVPAHQGVSRGPPPSYEDAVDPNAEPPSYDSLFGRIRDTHKASRNFIDFLAKLLILLLGTIGCTIACSITVIIPVCMIVIGSIYFDECPAEPSIPVFLIVGGSFSVFKYLLGVITRVGRGDTEEEHRTPPAQSLISCFLCGWFITGCVWVYGIYKPIMDEAHRGDPNYCNVTVYTFSFWLITTAYIFLGFLTSCICFVNIGSMILKREY
eukprot:maker-scaffold392_size185621-snap-gene-0.19 protein:Tk05909 transcript:maker-scaffold392_size185621-snap-gene-0.19-mRNA-1 annotation:"hypothetical protein L798_03698"